MGRVLQIRTRSGTIAANSYRYASCAIAGDVHSTTEAPAQTPYRTAGSLSKMEAYLTTNSNNGTTTVRSRINAGNGTLVASIATATTGKFSDTTHSDSIAAGDLVNYSIIAAGASGTIVCFHISSVFSATSGTSQRMSAEMATTAITTASTDYFWMPTNGSGSLQTNEAVVKTKMKVAGTLKNLFVYVVSNSSTNSFSVFSRKNEGAGGMSLSVTASSTGLFEDTSNTQAVAVDDYINYRINSGSGTPNFNVRVVGSEFVPTSGSKVLIEGGIAVGGSLGQGTTGHPRFGVSFGSANEYLQTAQIPMVLSNAFIYVSVNDVAASTFRTRVSEQNGNLSVSITGSTTGLFEDNTHTDVVATTDNINFQYVIGAGTTGITVIYFGCFAENIIIKTLTENLDISETKQKKTTKVLSENVSISNPVLKKPVKTISDNISFSEVLFKKTIKLFVENLAITEIKSVSRLLTKVLSENIEYLEAKIKKATKVLSENLSITELRKNTIIKVFTESQAITEVLVKVSAKYWAVIDSIAVSEVMVKKATKNLIENLAITENLSRIATLIRSFTENLAITEVVAKFRLCRVSLTENLAISEVLAKVGTFVRTFTENISIDESIASIKTYTRSLTENLAITESLSKLKTNFRAFTENLAITEVISKTLRQFAHNIIGKISSMEITGKTKQMYINGKIKSQDIIGKIKRL